MSTRRVVQVKRAKKNKPKIKANSTQNKPNQRQRRFQKQQNQQPQKTTSRRKKRGNRGQQTNNTSYGGPFNMGKATSRDYRCVTAEETIGLQASNDSSAFGVLNTYNINPGNASTFPLLSQEAAVFETYKFEYLEFYSVPSVSGYAAGGQTGSVSLSVDFNAAHAQPSTYTAAVDLDPADEDLPCNDLRIILPPEKMHAQNIAKFIRTGGLPGSSDIKTYDVGNLFVCAEGLSATQFNVNRLYCRYKCHLYTRVDVVGAGAPQNNSVSQFAQSYTASPASTGSVTIPFSAVITGGIVNGLGVINTAGVFTPPAGNYLWFVAVQSYNSTAANEVILVEMQKNGINYPTVVNLTADFGTIQVPNGDGVNFIVSQQLFVSCNGTDTVQVVFSPTYASGDNNYTAIMQLIAI